MGIKALIEGGSQIASAKIASNASKYAADTQMKMYDQTRSDLSPYMQTGNAALSQLASLWGLGGANGGVPNTDAMYSALTNAPGYQFGLKQGTTARDQAAASKGLVLSGGQLEAQQQFGSDYAMQQAWAPYVSQLNTLSSLGENAGAQVGNIGSTAAANAGTFQAGAGVISAQGVQGLGNTLAGAFQNPGSSYSGGGGGGYTGYGSNVAAGDPLAGLY